MVILKHACPIANWIAKLVQFLYCSIIYHADCNSGLLVLQMDLFVHSSGPFCAV